MFFQLSLSVESDRVGTCRVMKAGVGDFSSSIITCKTKDMALPTPYRFLCHFDGCRIDYVAGADEMTRSV